MELGATVCKPRQPDCNRCPLRKNCASLKFRTVDSLPNLGKRPVATAKEVTAVVIQFDDTFLVRRRPSGGINAHFWEFPTLDSSATSKSLTLQFKKTYGLKLKSIKKIQDIRHSITRFRITLTVYCATLASRPNGPLGPEWIWASWKELHCLPFTAAHRKIIKHLASPGTE